MAPQTVHPSVGLRDRLVRRYRQTCVASHNVRNIFLYLGFACAVIQVIKIAKDLTPEGIVFESLSAFISVSSGLFISQWPDVSQAVIAFKIGFGLSLLQALIFAAYLSGDFRLEGNEKWPLGVFFFAICWGLDRYILYTLNKSLKVIAELSTMLEKANLTKSTRDSGKSMESTPVTTTSSTESKKDQ
ncbi:hypothetical protein AAMO2058_000799800 [Amorphochlora amoebiformis]